MAKLAGKRSRKAGLPPGTLVHTGERKTQTPRIMLFDYDEQNFQEKQPTRIEECFPFKETATVTWINIDGLHDAGLIEKLGRQFELHPLILEDILSTEQRPKLEDYDKHLFIVVRMLTYNGQADSVEAKQVSMVVGANFLTPFQETVGDAFDVIRDRIRNAKGRIRKMGADYLAYSLIDAIVDNYFGILEKLGEKIGSVEEELVTEPSQETLRRIQSLKREMIFLRKSVWPLREVINGLQRSESSLVTKPTVIYLRDVYDHTIHIMDTIESFRDMISGMLEIYVSSISNKLNSIMKVLTIIATIFIPLTFIVGVYGMNFQNMPELRWRWSYPLVWVVIIASAVGMLVHFRKKKWF